MKTVLSIPADPAEFDLFVQKVVERIRESTLSDRDIDIAVDDGGLPSPLIGGDLVPATASDPGQMFILGVLVGAIMQHKLNNKGKK